MFRRNTRKNLEPSQRLLLNPNGGNPSPTESEVAEVTNGVPDSNSYNSGFRSEPSLDRERASIIQRIRQADTLEDAFGIATESILSALGLDRVLIYRFEGETEGQVISEALVEGWTPAITELIPCVFFGARNADEYRVKGLVSISEGSSLTAHQKQLLAKFQVRSSLAIPILLNSDAYSGSDSNTLDRAWGLLVLQQCSPGRRWTLEEINFIERASTELTVSLQLDQARQGTSGKQDILNSLTRQSQSTMQDRLQSLRSQLEADRVLVYAYNPDWSGSVLAESVGSEWEKASASFDKDFNLNNKDLKESYVVDDIYTQGFAKCLVEQLEALQAKAYIVVPIVQNGQLLGVLGAYQNSGPRNWQEAEVKLMLGSAAKFAQPLKQTEYIRHTQFQLREAEETEQRNKALASMREQMRSADSEEKVLQIATQEGRKILGLDRLAVYRFNPDWSGEFVAESMGAGWKSLMDTIPYVKDTFLQENQGGRYKFAECFTIDDIYLSGHKECHMELLEQFEARAYAIAPIMLADQELWGIFGAYHNSGAHKWTEEEVDVLRQICTQIGIALDQLNFGIKQDVISSLTRKSQSAMQNWLQSLRSQLKADRTLIYGFNPDGSGSVLVESVDSRWEKASASFDKDFNLNAKELKESYVVDDIYTQGFAKCLVEQLEAMQAKAYIVVPIVQNGQLLGVLGAYQNSGPRNWEEAEVGLMLSSAPRFAQPLKQTEYIRHTEFQKKKAEADSQRDRALAATLEQMRTAGNEEKALQIATQEGRKILGLDRLAVYRFNPDWSGEFVAESMGAGWKSLMETIPYVKDTFLQENQGGRYKFAECLTIDDIYLSGHKECHLELLIQFEARAYAIAPVLLGDKKLWGLVGAYHNTGVHKWTEEEVDALRQIATQIGIALEQISYVDKLQNTTQQLAQALEREKRAKETIEQQAIDLLTAVQPATAGDLTVRANVTEDEVGTIAAVYNTTLDSLTDLVIDVTTATQSVVSAADTSSSSIDALANQAQNQLQQVESARVNIQAMVEATTFTTQNALRVSSAVEKATASVQSGDAAMDNTVASIITVRETVVEAVKRVERLSESSQKIAKAVNLIGGFASQTNLLALNAALEATRAGEYGKGFAVVADEVRNLAYQSTEATAEIEKLVQEVQFETKHVAAAMEAGIQQVTEGTTLVTESRESLNEIVTATAEITQLVEGITQAANQQMQKADSAKAEMTQVSDIAIGTYEGSKDIVSTIQQLSSVVEDLQARINQFKVS